MRIKLLKIPLDIVPPEQLPEIIYDLLSPPPQPAFQPGLSRLPETSGPASLIPAAPVPPKENEGCNIVLLSLWDLLRARRNKEYRSFILKASLVLPISKSLISGAKFLTGKAPYRYMPFNFVISLLSVLEKREYAVYLLGGKKQTLKKAEKNIRQTFPKIRIVGRFTGTFKKQNEGDILEAIRKAAPHLLLVGKDVRGGELWIARNHFNLSKGLRLWCSDLLDIFAEKKNRPSEWSFKHGLEALGYCLKNPFKFFRIFSYFRYKLLLMMYRLFNK
jgi:N-acetylglucosaminyldiphosphoundecaprenol N-acetyl-beta-D-mannosaminyltransferase